MTTAYVPVMPKEHGRACQRGEDPANPGRLDPANCERCANLRARLDEAHDRRVRERALQGNLHEEATR